MQLYLLRHADAEPEAATDAARRLTEKGQEQAARVGRFCKTQRLDPDLILTSPYVRAEQTARAVAESTRAKLAVTDWLASGMSPQTAFEEIKAFRQLPSLMLVGHEPDLSRLIAFLLGLATPMQVMVRKASLTSLLLAGGNPGTAQLDFSLPCKLM